MILKRQRRQQQREKFIMILTLFVILLFLFKGESKSTGNLRKTAIDRGTLTVAILTKKRDNAFYLNEVVSSLKFSNVHIYDADKDHVDLKEEFHEQAFIHHIYDGEYTTYLPFKVSTDAHKTHRYDGVNVVRSTVRKKWWEHQNMDFLKMIRDLRDNHRSEYYLIMEDDNVYQGPDELLNIINRNEPIVHMGLGAGALLMSDAFLESFIGYMSLRTDAQPVDWLLEIYISSLGRKMVHRKLFKHVGVVSTKPDQRNGMF